MNAERVGRVLVVGAGPVGLFAASALTRQGVNCQILDESWRSGLHNYALALHPQTLKFLGELGLLEEILAHGRRVDSIGLYDGSGCRQKEIRLSLLQGPCPYLVVMPQSYLESVLEAYLERNGVQVRWNHRLSSMESGNGAVSAMVDELGWESAGYVIADARAYIKKTGHIEADFILGADGYHSAVRAALDIPFEQVGKTDVYLATEMRAETDFGNEIRLMLSETGINVIWPLPDGRCRALFQVGDELETLKPDGQSRPGVMLEARTGKAHSANPGEIHAIEAILRRAPGFAGKQPEVQWCLPLRFERRLVKDFGRGRGWLLGDAAHVTGPVGVQSSNLGFREAMDLAERLGKIVRSEGALTLLDEFNKEYHSHWRQLMGLAQSPKGVPGSTMEANSWLQGHINRLPSCIPASGQELKQLLGQIGITVV